MLSLQPLFWLVTQQHSSREGGVLRDEAKGKRLCRRLLLLPTGYKRPRNMSPRVCRRINSLMACLFYVPALSRAKEGFNIIRMRNVAGLDQRTWGVGRRVQPTGGKATSKETKEC
ncbi:hypothetical protein OS493_037452 [Desmophyllum pertusum]|uniref:Uncharacterized protein n=1 Tax=Desmophyllum pertusum TaxID=174260 RepID=A0A9W9ZV96_9CNID|nr:hypothetical protein OS493_037452 [Desmophyllum pertusum]